KNDFNKFPQTLIEFQEERTAECGQNIIDPYTGGSVHYTGVYGWNEMIIEDVDTKAKRKIISTEEFEKLKKIRLISTNSFFSTSRNLDIARQFIAGTVDNEHYKSILFHIKADTSLQTVIFADIEKFSRMLDEQEVLFSIGAVFEIDSVEFDRDLNVWKINMKIKGDSSNDIKQYTKSIKQELGKFTPSILFGRLLFIHLGQLEKAE
ncbi:unnamed protein product, partial [Didymodactylos carnosus]